MQPHLYNLLTLIWYKKLHHPIHFHCTFDHNPPTATHTLVFLHGIAATSKSWLPTVKQLSKDPDLQQYRLIIFDTLGFGKSLRADWLHYNYHEYNSALKHSLKKAKINTPITLVGHSMGSLIATDFAANFPKKIQSLILVSPPIFLAQEVAKLPDKFYSKSYTSISQHADNPALKTLANFVDKLSSFNAYYLSTTAFSSALKHIILNPQNYHTITHLKTPTTIIHGRFDPLVHGPNLYRAVKANPNHLKIINILGQHDLSPRKRDKIKEILLTQNQNETL